MAVPPTLGQFTGQLGTALSFLGNIELGVAGTGTAPTGGSVGVGKKPNLMARALVQQLIAQDRQRTLMGRLANTSAEALAINLVRETARRQKEFMAEAFHQQKVRAAAAYTLVLAEL